MPTSVWNFRIVRVILFLIIPLGLVVTVRVALSQTEESFTLPGEAKSAPIRYADAEARYQAAKADLAAEDMRIKKAQDTFAASYAIGPNVAATYLVTFVGPSRLTALLSAIQTEDEVKLHQVFTWVTSEGAVNITTGSHRAEELGWPTSSPDDIESRFKAFYVDSLDRTLKAIDEIAARRQSSGPRVPSESYQVLSNQRGETQSAKAEVQRQGIQVYGMTCLCTPAGLKRLEADVPGLGLRAVEIVGEHQFPIWPRDPIRDLVIVTMGKYGH